MTRVLGLEGTAWAASAAVFNDETEEILIESERYEPDSGGIHPREAAEHMREAIPRVIDRILTDTEESLDAIAFSRGPGLGPCLRTVGTAARSLAGTLDLPLMGVNHMIAHLEIGRHRSDLSAPVCLNASGANAHVLAYQDGRYRVLGETMDTGVGNAIDKFTRHIGWRHPGGPKVEDAARRGSYVELPYVVKGMDFSFAGITSAAQDRVDEGVAVEDVCCGLQETIFAMLAEVSERALSLTGRDELLLGGGVGQNRRLQEILEGMCTERSAQFYVPEDRFLQDNAGMIAVLGAAMFDAGATLAIEDSAVRPDFRPDDLKVTWRSPSTSRREVDQHSMIRGAEAVVKINDDDVCKHRLPKEYRHPDLDLRVRRERTAMEARLTNLARQNGVPTPVLRDVDLEESVIVFERVGSTDLTAAITDNRVREVAEHLATIHDAGFVHGDPTTRNVRVDPGGQGPFLIDFGLGYHTDDIEDYAMDLHVFEQSIEGTTGESATLRETFEESYGTAGDSAVLERLRKIEQRGRYQDER